MNQDWDEKSFCDHYENMWEISCHDVHYGWMSPGESELGLIKEFDRKDISVLDLGCGMGQNLVSLARNGAACYGVDISGCMLEKSEQIIVDNNVGHAVVLEQDDMRDMKVFQDIEFDIVMSIYSMEYLSGTQELRKIITNIYNKLKPGGVFLMCFSHPSQAQELRYPALMNQSVPLGIGKYKTYNYSFKDAMEALTKSRFSIERVIEQETINPSKISYAEGLRFPYHFRDGVNPFEEEMDEFSSHSPHTIIYKAKKYSDPVSGLVSQTRMRFRYRDIWGYKRKIVKSDVVRYMGLGFNVSYLTKMDNVVALVDILKFEVTSRSLAECEEVYVFDALGDEVSINGGSVLAQIHKKLQGMMLIPSYRSYFVDVDGENRKEHKIILEKIPGLDEAVVETLNNNNFGILVFVNGAEPSQGELPIDIVRANVGDTIEVIYVVLENEKELDTGNQRELF